MTMIRSNQEKELYKKIAEPEMPLPFKLETYESERYGKELYYIIPDDKKEEVLNKMWLFDCPPSLDKELLDIHEEKTFKMRDFKVIRFEEYNMLVSPYYFISGGTILDIIEPDDSSIRIILTIKK